MRIIWFIGGASTLGLAVLGIILPLLPTVPFLLLSAFCFANSSERAHDWLVNHPRLGPPIQDWRRSGSINPRAKRLATLCIGATFGISLLLGVGMKVLIIQAVVLSCVLLFIWTRPDH